MEEREMNVQELFHLMNGEDGEFFIRVILSEEGEMRGEKASGGFDTFGRGTTTYEQYADSYSY